MQKEVPCPMNSNRLSISRQPVCPSLVRAEVPGFVAVPHLATALPGMTDAAFRAWVALDQWAFRGAFPTNAELAQACGWFSPTTAEPAAWKAKRALAELERLGLVRRLTDGSAGYLRRTGLDVVRPADCGRGWGAGAPGVARPSPGGGAPAPRSLRSEEPKESIDRPSPPGTGPDREAAPRPAGRVREAEVEPKAREIHGRLYAGRSPALAAGDWRQWERSYLGVARDLLRGRLTEAQVAHAVAVGRRSDTNRWGARFLGAVRDARAGRPPWVPNPPAVATPAAAPPSSGPRPTGVDPGPPPRGPGEPLAAYFARCAALSGATPGGR